MVECQPSFPYIFFLLCRNVYGAENSKKSNGNTRTRTTARSSTKNKKVPTIEEGKGRKGGVFL